MKNPPEDLLSITDNELTQRIRKVMLAEAMFGVAKELRECLRSMSYFFQIERG